MSQTNDSVAIAKSVIDRVEEAQKLLDRDSYKQNQAWKELDVALGLLHEIR